MKDDQQSMDDQKWMARALELAAAAAAIGEVPVGAVIVSDSNIIGEAHNAPICNNDACAHAEVLAIRSACEAEQNYRLPNSTMYVTLEPCAMCAGALVHARVERVVIAAREPRAGAGGSVLNVLQHPQLNHRCEVEFGLMQQQSADMLKGFFRARRKGG
jgi:tRNA(adenine34) deaminase